MIEALNQTMCFAAVCEAGSMTAASRVLGCSKGHVSRSISAMEQRIKAKLFHRTTRKLKLTDAGSALQNEAVQLYKTALFVQNKSMTLNNSLSGSFVITAPISLATFLLSPILADMQQAFPAVEFKIIPTNENLDLVEAGVDLAIRTGSVVDDELIAHQIGLAHDVFYANANLFANHQLPQELNDLHGHRLLVNQYSMHGDTLKLYNGFQTVDWRAQDTMKVDLYTLIYDMVKQGSGVGFAPDYCLSMASLDDQIQPILSEWHGKEWPVYIVYPFHLPTPIKLAKISSYLKATLKSFFKQ